MLKKIIQFVPAAVVTAAIALPGGAMTESTPSATQVTDFSNQAKHAFVVKHHHWLYSFTLDADGMKVFKADMQGNNWQRVPNTNDVVDDVVSADIASIDRAAVFKQRVYMATQTAEGVGQVWAMCTHCRGPLNKTKDDDEKNKVRSDEWQQVGEDNLDGDSARTIIDFVSYQGTLYAYTTTIFGDGVIYSTTDGDTWTEVATIAGQANVAQVWRRHIDDTTSMYFGVQEAGIYRATFDDLTNWEQVVSFTEGVIASSSTMITDQRAGFFAVTDADRGVLVYALADDGSVSALGSEVNLGNANNDYVDRLIIRHGQLYAYLANDTAGAEIRRWDATSQVWEVVLDDGLADDSNFTAFDSNVDYHGKLYISLTNAADGAQIFQVRL